MRRRAGCSQTDFILTPTKPRSFGVRQVPTTALLIDGAAVNPAKSVRGLGISIDSDLVMGHMCNGQYRDVSLHSANYVRSAARCRQYVSVSSGEPCAIQAGLRKRRTDWPSGLPSTSSAVGTECGGTANVPHEIRGPYHRRCSLLRVPERIEHKVAVLTYKVLHGSAPRYLGPLVPVADLPG